jgi:hypothetical protein
MEKETFELEKVLGDALIIIFIIITIYHLLSTWHVPALKVFDTGYPIEHSQNLLF